MAVRVDALGDPAARATTGREVTRRSARAAVLTFASIEAGALVLWLHMGRNRWFYNDSWDFLAARRLGDVGDLFRPHNKHWSTLPIVVYRLLWWAFGVRTYVPYLLLVIVLHLTVAALLRVVMRRAGVDAWIATAAAGFFAFYGAGYENILDAFQIGFCGSLVFGLTHLLLADHDGPLDRRDGCGLAAGAAGMLCSGVAVTMIAVVGIAVFLRRGWRCALVHTAPLAVAYVVWWFAIAQDAPDNYTAREASRATSHNSCSRGCAVPSARWDRSPGSVWSSPPSCWSGSSSSGCVAQADRG
jgi:hypothetical protein